MIRVVLPQNRMNEDLQLGGRTGITLPGVSTYPVQPALLLGDSQHRRDSLI